MQGLPVLFQMPAALLVATRFHGWLAKRQIVILYGRKQQCSIDPPRRLGVCWVLPLVDLDSKIAGSDTRLIKRPAGCVANCVLQLATAQSVEKDEFARASLANSQCQARRAIFRLALIEVYGLASLRRWEAMNVRLCTQRVVGHLSPFWETSGKQSAAASRTPPDQ